MTQPAASAPSTSVWEDFIDVFISPVELFRRRADGRFGHALVMLLVLTALVYFGTRSAMQPIYDADIQRSMAGRPDLSPEAMESAKKLSASLTPVVLLILVPAGAFILGAVILLAAWLVGGRLKYAQGATIATFAFFPRLVEGIASGAQALLLDEAKLTSRLSVSLGIGRFLDREHTNSMLLALLGRVDVFTLWATLLVAIGIKQMTRVSTGRAAAAAALVWLLGALPTLLRP